MITDYEKVPIRFLRHDLAQIDEIAPFVEHIPDMRVILIHKMITTYQHKSAPDWYKDELLFYLEHEFMALQTDKINYDVMKSQIADLQIGEVEEKSDDHYLDMLKEYEDASA